VTATKAVVWHFTNPDVKFLSTGFLARSGNEPDSPNGIKHRQFLALFDALANGAEGYAADPSQGLYSDDEVRPYGIDFDNANAGISPVDDGSGLVWGPCYVRETDASYSSRPAGNVKRVREPALLQLSSPIAGTVFYDGHPDQGGKPLKSEPIYGNGSGTLPGLPVSDPVDENPSSDAPFYIFLPLQDEEDLQKATAVTALAKEELSEVNGREVEVPTVLVYQDPVTGQQDWNMVQAFIGAGHDPLVQYANAAIPFGSSGSGQVSVSKVHYAGSGGPFRFQITDAGGAPVYLHDGNFSKYHESAGNAEIISGIDGTFSLNDGSMGVISGLPFGEYAITESFSDDYSASYDVYDSNAFKTAAGRTVSFEVTEKQPTAAVVCRNSPGPFDISIAKISTGSEGSPLEGARFRIERQDGGFVDEKYSDKAGGVIFTDLLWSFSAPDMRSYTITELAAPSGYTRMSGPIKIALDDNGIISTAETDPADAELVYIDGIGSRHLRLMISNAPVPPPKPITPGTGVIPPPPGPPAPAPPTPTSPAVTPPPPTPPAPVPPAPVPPTPPDSGTTPPPPDSGDTPPAPPTPVPPIEPPGPGSTPPHDPSATPPGPGGTPPHVSGATPPPEDYTTLGLGALPTDYYLTSPQTDDNSNIPLWALLGGAALAGLILVGAALRRRWQANRAG
ncbi:MAG: prealbumin-like fold domain-containing protein, partial [Clostridiales Family XIII bacterium]|nr:prealbumin-like fold domain-containing protein [Clostridiales Family XIII bacterium]